MASSLLLITTLVFLAIPISYSADSMMDVMYRSCQNGFVENVEQYNRSYSRLVEQMEDEMVTLKFAFAEGGTAPDRLFMFAQCYTDMSSEMCRECFYYIAGLLQSCIPQTGGRAYTDGCYIRAENYSFFTEVVSPTDARKCSDSTDERPSFRYTAWKAIGDVIMKAAEDGGFAYIEHKKDDITVYALANCWKSLGVGECGSCLDASANIAIKCVPSTEGKVFSAGCIIRYADFQFSNSTMSISAQKSIIMYVGCIMGAIAICTSVIVGGFFAGKVMYTEENGRRSYNGLDLNMSVITRNFQILQFKYLTLEKATECFNEVHKLGQGGYGEVFKGTLPDGREIAIKRLFTNGKTHTEDVCNEIDIISGAQHKNLVRLLGCCFTVSNSFLVYEFLPNRSLDSILFDTKKKRDLDWKKRLAIIIGTAEGLQYLHNDCHVRIIHRDIKASNILLDIKYKPKIADFGLARFGCLDNSLISIAIAGTLGYMAPEYLAQGRLTEKVDVFSFGVLVLEIVSGVQNNRPEAEDRFETLITQVWNHFQTKTLAEIVDGSMEKDDIEEMIRVLQVGLLCTQEIPSSRPSMTKVIKFLTTDIEMPDPHKPPFTDDTMELSLLAGYNSRQPPYVGSFC